MSNHVEFETKLAQSSVTNNLLLQSNDPCMEICHKLSQVCIYAGMKMPHICWLVFTNIVYIFISIDKSYIY